MLEGQYARVSIMLGGQYVREASTVRDSQCVIMVCMLGGQYMLGGSVYVRGVSVLGTVGVL